MCHAARTRPPRADMSRPWIAASVLACFGACHAHTPHPGQVRVIEYGEGAEFVEVELDELRARTESAEFLWIHARASFDTARCSDASFWFASVGGVDAPRLRAPFAFESAGRVLASEAGEEGEHAVPVVELRDRLRPGEVYLSVAEHRMRLHDEHLFNLRQFAEQVECPSE